MPNQNNNTECCEKCYIYGSYADIRCYNLKCPCHSDTSEKECNCNNHNIGEELCRCKKHHDFSQPIQSSWGIDKIINAETIENLFKDFYDGDWYADTGDWVKLDRIASELKEKIKNLLESEHKKWIENK